MKSVILNNELITTREAARELKDYSKVIVREKETLYVCAYEDFSIAVDNSERKYLLLDSKNNVRRCIECSGLQEFFDTLLKNKSPRYFIFIKEDDE